MRQSEVLSLMRENVAYKLQHGKAKEAVDMLEKLHKYVKFIDLYTEVACVAGVRGEGKGKDERAKQANTEQGCGACTLYELSIFTPRWRAAFSVTSNAVEARWPHGSGSSGQCSSPQWPVTLCCVLGQDTSLSQCLSLRRCINGYRQI